MQLWSAKDIILYPDEEWFRIQDEEDRRSLLRYGMQCLIFSFGVILLVSLLFLAHRALPQAHSTYGALYWMVAIIIRFGLSVLSLIFIPTLLAELAPSFQGERDTLQALKLYVFAETPTWIGIIFGTFGTISGSIYTIYLLWKFAGDALAVPEGRKVGYVIASVFLLTILQWLFIGIGMMLATMIAPSS